jgi:hypothetical protein
MPQMNKADFMRIMSIPAEWDALGMWPEELVQEQLKSYSSGDERASEHDRNGMFHWWLRREPTSDQLLRLVKLTHLDPEPLMAEDVRNYIRRSKNCNSEVLHALQSTA